MGRRGGGGSSGGYSSRAPSRRPSPAPASRRPASSPASQDKPNSLAIAAKTPATNIAEGVQWGIGSAIGHRMVDSLFGYNHEVIHEIVTPGEQHNTEVTFASAPAPDACLYQYTSFQECLNNMSDISVCQSYIDRLKECRGQPAGMA